jgi:hypothetical protein
MVPGELFIWTIHDLDERLNLGRGEYDAFCMAWLLRKLLGSGERSLVSIVAQDREAVPRFVVHDGGDPPEDLGGWWPVAPQPGSPTVELDQVAFLNHVAAQVRQLGEEFETAKPHKISVRKLISFLANNMGAVHVTHPSEPWQEALWDYCWSAIYTTPEGQYSGGVACLIDVARVARAGLEPLREEISPEVWPEGTPAFARNVRRLRPASWT